MTNLWLIAHKVRGEPAFDIATQMECPECTSTFREEHTCVECDGTGYWWIIPTSGHRAYPYWSEECSTCIRDWCDVSTFRCPDDLPDHYQSRAEPSRLAQLKAMLPPAKPIHRRF